MAADGVVPHMVNMGSCPGQHECPQKKEKESEQSATVTSSVAATYGLISFQRIDPGADPHQLP